MLRNCVVMAIRAIRRNVLRSLLTILGVVIGVAAVIMMVTVGDGATQAVKEEITSLGSNLLMVRPGQMPRPGMGITAAPNFDLADAEAIAWEVSAVEAVAPSVAASTRAVFSNRNWSSTVVGSTSAYFEVGNWEFADGRPFTDAEERSGAAVCVIGETVREELFGDADPIGQKVRVNRFACEVVGLLEAKGQSTLGADGDDLLVMPLKTVQRRVRGNDDITGIQVAVQEGASATETAESIRALLRERRDLTASEDDDFSVIDTKQIADTLSSTVGIMTMLLGAVAAISLLVGGIGIMNIMLVSVTERTREIGIRLAIGALEGEVMLQFLIESVALASFGGAVGIVLANVGSLGLTSVLGVPYLFNLEINAVSFLSASLVGVAFGYVPARRAARLDPIDALRHE